MHMPIDTTRVKGESEASVLVDFYHLTSIWNRLYLVLTQIKSTWVSRRLFSRREVAGDGGGGTRTFVT